MPNKLYIVVLIVSLVISYGIKYNISTINLIVDLGIGIVLFGISCLPLIHEYKT